MKEQALYLAYLSGYGGGPIGDAVDCDWDNAQPDVETAYAAAWTQGAWDQRRCTGPRALRSVLIAVRDMLAADDAPRGRITTDQAATAARAAIEEAYALRAESTVAMVAGVAKAIERAVNGE